MFSVNGDSLKRRVRPTPGYVFLLADKEPEAEGLIIKPEQYRNRTMPQTGRVLAVGGRLKTKKGVVIEPEFKKGDKVLFKKFSATWVDIEGKQFAYCRHGDVEAVLLNE